MVDIYSDPGASPTMFPVKIKSIRVGHTANQKRQAAWPSNWPSIRRECRKWGIQLPNKKEVKWSEDQSRFHLHMNGTTLSFEWNW